MALFEKLKKLLGIKPKGYIQNNFFESNKSSAIKEFESKENDFSFEEHYENLQGHNMGVSAFYLSEYVNGNTYVVCEKMFTDAGDIADGYPKYKILTKENGEYTYRVVSYQTEINYSNVNIEACIKIEYSDNMGFKSQYIYKSEIENGDYKNKEMVDECLRIITEVKENSEKINNQDLQK